MGVPTHLQQGSPAADVADWLGGREGVQGSQPAHGAGRAGADSYRSRSYGYSSRHYYVVYYGGSNRNCYSCARRMDSRVPKCPAPSATSHAWPKAARRSAPRARDPSRCALRDGRERVPDHRPAAVGRSAWRALPP